MSSFITRVAGLLTGSTANAFITVLAIKLPATAGCRARLRRITISGDGAAPQDLQVSLRLRRTGNTSDGTSTAVNVNTIGSDDPNSGASIVAAIGKNFSAEPTTFETGTLGIGSFNSRGSLSPSWGTKEAPQWGPSQTLCLEAAPGSAVAANLAAVAEWDEF